MNNFFEKICLITGGTSGIGAAAANKLAQLGFMVIIVGRNEKKCLRQIKKIKQTNPDAKIDYLLADLSSQNQIRKIAYEFSNRYSHLDVLVNNAGAYFARRELNADGLEMTFALNHISYFLLTNLLLNHLKESVKGRIIIVSSEAHKQGHINFDDLQSERNYNRNQAYANSKLANMLFTYSLSKRLESTNVTANALHPGSVATNIGANDNWLKTKLRNFVKRGMISPDKGAETIIYLATSPDVEGITGKYFYKCSIIYSSKESHNETSGENLWSLSERITGLD